MKKKNIAPDLENIIPILIHVWRKHRKEPGPPDKLQTREFRSAVEGLKKLQSLQDGNYKGDYYEDPDILSAYLLYQWSIHYQQALSVLNELPHEPERVLDVCSGLAPMGFAALRHGAKEVIATDKSLKAMELGAEVAGRYGYPMTIRKWDCLKGPLSVEGSFDLITLGHSLQELFPSAKDSDAQNSFVKNLLKKLTPNGCLVLIENSFVEANKRVLKLRDFLVKAGVPVQAPCVWKGECPALQMNNSPCYAQRVMEKPYLIKEFQRAANINLNSLKMTYIIFRNPSASWPELGSERLYRVISPPVETYQGKRYYLCGVDGKKNLGCRFKETPPEARAFDYLKRGELISVSNALEKQNNLDIMEGTRVSVEAACGKPLKEGGLQD